MEPISRRMGNGSDTLFWSSNWIGGTPLAVTFPRLFSLCNQKDNLVVDLLEVYEERRSWSFSWRRYLFQWEEELVKNLIDLLESVVLSPGDDWWCSLLDPDNGFSVKSSYKLLSEDLLSDEVADVELVEVLDQIWDSSVSYKVIAFSWQLLYDRISTRDNLEVRGILGVEKPWECV
jgi:hypothetical protein